MEYHLLETDRLRRSQNHEARRMLFSDTASFKPDSRDDCLLVLVRPALHDQLRHVTLCLWLVGHGQQASQPQSRTNDLTTARVWYADAMKSVNQGR